MFECAPQRHAANCVEQWKKNIKKIDPEDLPGGRIGVEDEMLKTKMNLLAKVKRARANPYTTKGEQQAAHVARGLAKEAAAERGSGGGAGEGDGGRPKRARLLRVNLTGSDEEGALGVARGMVAYSGRCGSASRARQQANRPHATPAATPNAHAPAPAFHPPPAKDKPTSCEANPSPPLDVDDPLLCRLLTLLRRALTHQHGTNWARAARKAECGTVPPPAARLPKPEAAKMVANINNMQRAFDAVAAVDANGGESKLVLAGRSNWATRHSTSKIIMYNQAAILWASKKQPSFAMSSCKAEIIAALEATKETVYLRDIASSFAGVICPTASADRG
eukprot:3050036-Pleurochrysis_carterae.AAC.2